MSRRRIEERRILGPYEEGNEWRIVVFDPRAEKKRSSFKAPSKSAIDELIEDIQEGWSEVDAITVSIALKAYREALVRKGTTEASAKETVRRIGIMFSAGDRLVADLRESECSALYDKMTERLKPNGETVSVAFHRTTLIQARSWLRWCVKKKKWLQSNPLEDVDGIGTAKKGKPQLTGDEARKLRVWLMWRVGRDDEAALALMMVLTMALRQEDIVQRVVRDVDLDGTVLRVRDGKTEMSDRNRVIPEELQPGLRKLVEGRESFDVLFRTPKGKPHTNSWLRSAMKRFSKAAGVPYACPHSLKGTAGSVAHIVGQTAEAVADYLSHEEVRTQQHYVRPGVAQDAATARGMKLINWGRG